MAHLLTRYSPLRHPVPRIGAAELPQEPRRIRHRYQAAGEPGIPGRFTGTHVVFAAAIAPYATSELALAPDVLAALRPDMLCLADRFPPSFDLWQQAAASGAAGYLCSGASG